MLTVEADGFRRMGKPGEICNEAEVAGERDEGRTLEREGRTVGEATECRFLVLSESGHKGVAVQKPCRPDRTA